jgi:cytochrome o ubiquinol oxidase subunit 1
VPTAGSPETLAVPRNSALGFVLAFFAVVAGFALIWHIVWMAAAGLVGIAATTLAYAWRTSREVEIPRAELAAFDGRSRGLEATA